MKKLITALALAALAVALPAFATTTWTSVANLPGGLQGGG